MPRHNLATSSSSSDFRRTLELKWWLNARRQDRHSRGAYGTRTRRSDGERRVLVQPVFHAIDKVGSALGI
jgi:hypothetical protein